MNETSPGVIDAETPVNPYSLLEAVNRSSDSANAAWLIYMALMSYLLLTVAGVGHKELLLSSDVVLPILGVKIELTRFFIFAPILVVLLHVGLMGQLVQLARKTLEFAASIRMLETSDQRTHPLRLELNNFFFVQAIAGPERSRIVGMFLHGMSWLTILALPVLLLLYIQLVFLPYHDVGITWVHRVALIADIALLVFIGMFMWRLETSFLRAFLRTSLHHPVSLLLTAGLLVAVALFSIFVATIPGEAGEQSTAPPGARQASDGDGRRVFGYTVQGLAEGSLLGFFQRNLNVTDTDLVIDKDVTPGRPTLNLRGRDLRFARFDRTDLHQADMTGANLDGASLVGTDLRGVWMSCANLNALLLSDSHRAGQCASARGTNLSKARLAEAKMVGVDMRSAKLDEARLEGAQLGHAILSGASFASARLEGADLSGAWLHGANFIVASLQGADLSGAKLEGADFTSATMQGASLALAGLEGASLRDAELEGANLAMGRLAGADLSGAKMQGSDMRGAVVWRALPPAGGDVPALADMAQIVIQQPAEDEWVALAATLLRLEDGQLAARLGETMARLSDGTQNGAWSSSPEQQLWQALAKATEGLGADDYKGRLTEYLARLACRARFADGAVAAGVARRAMAPGFKGDMPALYVRLKSAECAASASMSPRLMRELAAAVDAARGQ
jgi:uncharacterized protein YjbI with pentapeptide repeats